MVNAKAINAWTARVTPAVLVGIAAYGAYGVIGQVGVIYLLAPRQNGYTNIESRPGTAIAIIVLFSVLILFVAWTYFRLIYTIVVNPGYVPLSQAYYDSQSQTRKPPERRRRSNAWRLSDNAEKGSAGLQGMRYEQTAISSRPSPASEQTGLAYFYSKDVFVCEGDGRPPWCTTCLDWKPDRAHHCREVQRCVRKMDHFCPWVGGIVSETNFKFFIQFNIYTLLLCIFSGIVLAYYLADQSIKQVQFNVHLPITLAFASLFGLFSGGMTLMATGYAIRNLTSIEVLSDKVKVWSLAVHLPNPPPPNAHPPYQMITFPLVIDPNANPPPPQRTFAILHSHPGESPFDLGKFENWQSVMGYTVWDWLLPVRYSPCCNHDSAVGDFQMGPVLERMKERAGLLPSSDGSAKRPRRRHRSTRSARHDPRKPKDSQEVHLQTPSPNDAAARTEGSVEGASKADTAKPSAAPDPDNLPSGDAHGGEHGDGEDTYREGEAKSLTEG